MRRRQYENSAEATNLSSNQGQEREQGSKGSSKVVMLYNEKVLHEASHAGV